MSDHRLRKTPMTIDNVVPILFWEPVDFIAAMAIFGMGVAMKMFILGVIGAVITLMVATRLRQGAKRGAAQHWMWHMGLTIDRALSRAKLKSWQNDFIN